MLNPSRTVSELVLDHSECAPVFKRHRIDFCCRGDVSLEAACASAGVDPDTVLGELSSAIAQRQGPRGRDMRALSTPALIEHIVSKHHEYLRETLPFIEALANKVSRVHGDRDARLIEIDDLVRRLSAALLPHIDDEEKVLFPALVAEIVDEAVVRRELASMHDDHLDVGGMLVRLRQVTIDFAVPEWGCNSYRTLFSELEAFEGDVLEHVHLENHVLMPRFSPAS